MRRVMGWSAMHVAAAEGRPAALRALVAGCGCSLVARSANSWTPLHCAAAHGQARSSSALPAHVEAQLPSALSHA